MTRIVRPSEGTGAEASELAVAIYNMVGRENWIAESGTDYATNVVDTLNTGPKNAFEHVGNNGLTVTIDTGEAFIGGCYVAADEQTSFEMLDEDDTTLYVGYSRGGPDQFRFGTESEIGAEQPKTPVYEATTSGGQVTSITDVRNTGEPVSLGGGGSTGDLPMTRIRYGRQARNVDYIPPGSNLRLTRYALLDEDGNAPTGLELEIRDLSTKSVLFSTNQTNGEGTLDDPIQTISGDRAIQVGIYNDTGDVIVAGATYDYVISEV